jgi:hypothetical protein
MRHLHSEFHFRHALFALQGPEGYVDAMLEMARETGAARPAAISFRRMRGRPGAASDQIRAQIRAR